MGDCEQSLPRDFFFLTKSPELERASGFCILTLLMLQLAYEYAASPDPFVPTALFSGIRFLEHQAMEAGRKNLANLWKME
jgi:hypothetical protein